MASEEKTKDLQGKSGNAFTNSNERHITHLDHDLRDKKTLIRIPRIVSTVIIQKRREIVSEKLDFALVDFGHKGATYMRFQNKEIKEIRSRLTLDWHQTQRGAAWGSEHEQ
jgi:hypothetical protein